MREDSRVSRRRIQICLILHPNSRLLRLGEKVRLMTLSKLGCRGEQNLIERASDRLLLVDTGLLKLM